MNSTGKQQGAGSIPSQPVRFKLYLKYIGNQLFRGWVTEMVRANNLSWWELKLKSPLLDITIIPNTYSYQNIHLPIQHHSWQI